MIFACLPGACDRTRLGVSEFLVDFIPTPATIFHGSKTIYSSVGHLERSEKLWRKEYVTNAAKTRMYLGGKRANVGISYVKSVSGQTLVY